MNREKFLGITDSRNFEKSFAFKKLKKKKRMYVERKAMPPPLPRQINASWMLKPLSREETRRIENAGRPIKKKRVTPFSTKQQKEELAKRRNSIEKYKPPPKEPEFPNFL